jgi:hypothetical protein
MKNALTKAGSVASITHFSGTRLVSRLEVEPDCDLGAMHYDPIEEVGVMVVVE